MYIWYVKENKMYVYCAAQECRGRRELAVYVLTDSLKMNVEGGGKE